MATTTRRDRGSGPVTALLVLGALALVFAMGVTMVGTVAGDESSSAQHAADAAALAGAQGVVDDLPVSLAPGFVLPSDIPLLLGGGTCVQTGRLDATQLAAANGATLTTYCYNVYRDQVTVDVRMNGTAVDGPPTKAGAEAASTFEASSCSLDPSFEAPTPSPSPSPSPSDDDDDEDDPPPPPPPPSRIASWVDCGFGRLDVVFTPADGRFHFIDPVGMAADLKPRLTK